MRILITGDMGEGLPPPYGGIIKRALMHAKYWRESGAEVIFHVYAKHESEDDLGAGAKYVYDFFKKPSYVDKVYFVLKNLLLSPYTFFWLMLREIKVTPVGISYLLFFSAGRGTIIKRLILKSAPDVIVTETGGFQSFVVSLIGKKYKIPVIIINSAEILVMKDHAKLWRTLLNNVDLVVSTSEHCSNGPRRYLEDLTKLKIVYSGIDYETFARSLDKKSEARTNFGLPADKFVIISVGALSGRKGHDQLLEAVLTIPEKERSEIVVALCGMGNRQDFEKSIESIGFPRGKLNIFQGLSEMELSSLYHASDCFAFPSTTARECMGLALKEALSAGLPVVGYCSGGIPEAVVEGVNGFLANVSDTHGLGEAILKVLRLSESQRAKMGATNAKKAENLFDMRKTAGTVYDEALRLKNLYS